MMADETPGPDTIVFEDGLTTISLDDELVVSSNITLSGDTDGDGDGDTDIHVRGQSQTFHFLVERGAQLTLEDVALIDGSAVGNSGLDGDFGDFELGSDGEDGADGKDAAASIINYGKLTLDEVVFSENDASGGDVGDGGDGFPDLADVGSGGLGGEFGEGGDFGAAVDPDFNVVDYMMIA